MEWKAAGPHQCNEAQVTAAADVPSAPFLPQFKVARIPSGSEGGGEYEKPKLLIFFIDSQTDIF